MKLPETLTILLHEALKLFAEYGYDGTSIADLAQATKIRKSSVYYYFDTKEDVALKIVKDTTLFCEVEILSILRDETLDHNEKIAHFTRAINEYFTKNPNAICLLRFLMDCKGLKLERLQMAVHYHFERWLESFDDAYSAVAVTAQNFRALSLATLSRLLGYLTTHQYALLTLGLSESSQRLRPWVWSEMESLKNKDSHRSIWRKMDVQH